MKQVLAGAHEDLPGEGENPVLQATALHLNGHSPDLTSIQ
jgi:hypothetical protein